MIETPPDTPTYAPLDRRAVLWVAGADARPFLQGLVSNDIDRVSPAAAIYAALLSPQGKYLHDFFVAERDGALWLDCDGARADDLARRLRMYRLRAKVEIETPDPAPTVYALFGAGAVATAGTTGGTGACRPLGGGVAFADPRLPDAGARAILPAEDVAALEDLGFHPGSEAEYDVHRLRLGLPESGLDLVPDRSYPLECGFDELHGVDFDKGCYVGQEVTARMKHRKLVRKRLLPVRLDGPVPEPGTAVVRAGVEVGELRSAADGLGLALLRLDRIEDDGVDPGQQLMAGATPLVPQIPDWLAR